MNINGKRKSSNSKYHCNTSNIRVHLSNLKHEDALHCLQITWSNQDKLVQNWAAISISALSRDVTQDNEDHMTQVKNYPFAAFLFFTGLIYEVVLNNVMVIVHYSKNNNNNKKLLPIYQKYIYSFHWFNYCMYKI